MRINENELMCFSEDCMNFLIDKGFFEEYPGYERIFGALTEVPAWILNTRFGSRPVAPNVIDLGNVPKLADLPDNYREQALKVLEEAAECHAAAQAADNTCCQGWRLEDLAEETADVIHAAANLLMMLNPYYQADAMHRVISKNAKRGRY